MYEQNKNNQFKLFIPNEISSDFNLNLSEMKVLATIKALDKQNKCFATNSYIAECLQLSTRHVSRIISSLEKKGYIAIENKNSFKRKITVQIKRAVQVQVQEKQTEKVIPIKQQSKQPSKIEHFNAMYSHDWDLDELERLEENYLKNEINNMTFSERGKELINGTKYTDAPTEWTGVTQLAFRGC